jgi:hypothetical protein
LRRIRGGVFWRGTATNSRDENLKARIPAAAGESKEERKRERLSEPSRSILDAPDAAVQSSSVSSRCPEWLGFFDDRGWTMGA